jgi:hypothetical protein
MLTLEAYKDENPMLTSLRTQKDRQWICPLCHKRFENKAALSNHYKACRVKQQQEIALKNGELVCDYGCGRVAQYQFRNGRVCCSKGTSSCPAMRRKNSIGNTGRKYQWEHGHPKGMKGKVPWNKGLTVDDYPGLLGAEKVASYRQKLRSSLQGKNAWTRMSERAQEEAKQKLTESIEQRYDTGWMPKAGRCKKIRYESAVCGRVSLDGFWELLVAIYLDFLNVTWVRNTRKFEYVNLQGNRATYTPDFYVKDWNKYIEVKGYEDDLSRYKKRQFQYPIEVWGKSRIRQIEKFLTLTVDDLRKRYQRSNKGILFGEVLERP